MPGVLIATLVEEHSELTLCVHAGHRGCDDHKIAVPRIQKPGLALAGYAEQLHSGRLLTLGGTEIDYLSEIGATERAAAVTTVMNSRPACIVITRGLLPPAEFVAACDRLCVPLLTTRLPSAEFIKKVTHCLDVRLAPETSVHGVMVDVLEVGILLRGRSGVGKSEAALELVERGHRLVTDDVVCIYRRADDSLVGSSTKELGHHMEIRGLGIINIADLFGITSIRDSKQLDLVIELAEWDTNVEYDRLGVDETTVELLDVSVPFMRIPVRPGRNLASIIEVAARTSLLRSAGYNPVKQFLSSLDARLVRAGENSAD